MYADLKTKFTVMLIFEKFCEQFEHYKYDKIY